MRAQYFVVDGVCGSCGCGLGECMVDCFPGVAFVVGEESRDVFCDEGFGFCFVYCSKVVVEECAACIVESFSVSCVAERLAGKPPSMRSMVPCRWVKFVVVMSVGVVFQVGLLVLRVVAAVLSSS